MRTLTLHHHRLNIMLEPALAAFAVVATAVPTAAIVGVVAEADSPYVALGIGGVLLGALVVPMFRWLLARADRQQAAQDALIAALQKSVEKQADDESIDIAKYAAILESLHKIEGMLEKRGKP